MVNVRAYRAMRSSWKVIASIMCMLAVTFLPACHNAAAADGDHPTLHIAAASAMRPVMGDLMAEFQAVHPGTRTTVTFGASGNLYAQITNRAPIDLFLASDCKYPEALIRDNHAAGPITHYATGHLVFWIAHDSLIDLSAGLDEALHDPVLRRLAIATPRHAPYGRAAKEVLERVGVYEQLKARLILGENVEQAAKFAHTGAADAAIIPATIALQPAMQSGRHIRIAEDLCPGIRHGAVILPRGDSNQAAQDFLEFIRSNVAHRVFHKHGLTAGTSTLEQAGTN